MNEEEVHELYKDDTGFHFKIRESDIDSGGLGQDAIYITSMTKDHWKKIKQQILKNQEDAEKWNKYKKYNDRSDNSMTNAYMECIDEHNIVQQLKEELKQLEIETKDWQLDTVNYWDWVSDTDDIVTIHQLLLLQKIMEGKE